MENNQRKFSKKKLFVDRDKESLVWFVWELSKDHFIKAFAKKGITITNESDVATVARLIKNGGDKRGDIKLNGKPLVFDSYSILNSLDIPTEVLRSSNVKFIE